MTDDERDDSDRPDEDAHERYAGEWVEVNFDTGEVTVLPDTAHHAAAQHAALWGRPIVTVTGL